jgi:hypothetical protein
MLRGRGSAGRLRDESCGLRRRGAHGRGRRRGNWDKLEPKQRVRAFGPAPSNLPAPDYRARRTTVWLWLPASLPALTLDLTFICFSFTPDI